MLRTGLLGKWNFSELRTYGYPLFVGVTFRLPQITGIPHPVWLFVLQLAAYIAAALFLRRALATLSLTAARIAFAGLMLNYYVLLFTPYRMTESLSITFMVATAACWLALQQNRALLWPLIVGSLLAGFSVMLRPANIFLAATWVLACAMVLRWDARNRVDSCGRVALVIVTMALPATPQFLNNIRHYGVTTPLVAAKLGTAQLLWSVLFSKYATGAGPEVAQPQVFYDNPFYAGTEVNPGAPLHWYLEHPGRGAMTIALHVFNLTDQDLLFPYSRDLHPWYRLPLGIINHAAVALGLFGLGLMWRNAFKTRQRPAVEQAAALTTLLAASCGVYAATAVEMRFGLPLLLVLFPLAGYAITFVVARETKIRWAVAAYVVVYATTALIVSDWVRAHAAQIAQTEGAGENG